MKKYFLAIGLAISLMLGGTAAHAATKADTDGVILFTANSSALGPKAKKEIKAFIDANPTAASFAVTGYVQKAGSDRNNSRLSLARANAVKKYIATLGNTKTVAVTGGGISTTNPKSKNSRKAVLTAVAAPTPTPTPSASVAPASYDVSIKSTPALTEVSINEESIVPMNGASPTPEQIRALVSFDYVQASGQVSLNNSLPTALSDLANFKVQPDTNVTVRIGSYGLYQPLMYLPTLPACAQFMSGLDVVGNPATSSSQNYQSITVKIISNNCAIEFSPGLPT